MTWLVAIALALASGTQAAAPARHVVVTSTICGILPQIVFARGSAQLPTNSDETLAAIASTLDGNPSLRLVAIEGNVLAADAHDTRARETLALRRATAVRNRLIALGVAPARLIARAGTGHDPVIDFIVLARAAEP
jgi:outer membrane protein OmpA-like peptidoglycan-associated protein